MRCIYCQIECEIDFHDREHYFHRNKKGCFDDIHYLMDLNGGFKEIWIRKILNSPKQTYIDSYIDICFDYTINTTQITIYKIDSKTINIKLNHLLDITPINIQEKIKTILTFA